MKTIYKFTFITFLSAFASCSVFEDRSGCPNIMNVTIDERQEERPSIMGRKTTVTLRNAGGGDGFRSTFTPSDYPSGYGIVVPKGTYSVSLVSCAGDSIIEKDAVRTSGGKEADSLFVNCIQTDCLGEETFLKALLFKQFTTLKVFLSNLPASRPSLWVESSWNGLEMYTLNPVKGDYGCWMREIPDGPYEARVPRCGGGPLTVRIGGTGNSSPEVSYDIYDEIVARGFDWNAASLSDITLTLDYLTGKVLSLTIICWDETLIETEI